MYVSRAHEEMCREKLAASAKHVHVEPQPELGLYKSVTDPLAWDELITPLRLRFLLEKQDLCSPSQGCCKVQRVASVKVLGVRPL